MLPVFGVGCYTYSTALRSGSTYERKFNTNVCVVSAWGNFLIYEMNYTKEQVFQLYVGRLSGHISPEEERILDEKLQSDPVFRRQWQSLEEEASEMGLRTFLSELDVREDPSELELQVMPPSVVKRGIRLKKALAVAAIILLIGCIIFICLLKILPGSKS